MYRIGVKIQPIACMVTTQIKSTFIIMFAVLCLAPVSSCSLNGKCSSTYSSLYGVRLLVPYSNLVSMTCLYIAKEKAKQLVFLLLHATDNGTGNVEITLDQGTYVLLYSLVCSPAYCPVRWRSR